MMFRSEWVLRVQESVANAYAAPVGQFYLSMRVVSLGPISTDTNAFTAA